MKFQSNKKEKIKQLKLNFGKLITGNAGVQNHDPYMTLGSFSKSPNSVYYAEKRSNRQFLKHNS